jgi:hypothetical protein
MQAAQYSGRYPLNFRTSFRDHFPDRPLSERSGLSLRELLVISRWDRS